MQLTAEQQAVVELSHGRHLVLAPPGSGKTEMLTQRIFRALSQGVDSSKMFCVTFTVRAAVEMRERVQKEMSRQTGECGYRLPDIGNIHHFCHAFLVRNRIVPQDKAVLDEIGQKDIVKDVMASVKERLEHEGARDKLFELGRVIDEYRRKRRSIYPDLVVAITHLLWRKRGIPFRMLLPVPYYLRTLYEQGVLQMFAEIYDRMKQDYFVIDFDDLLAETYLALKNNPDIAEASRFEWIQIDEVQDLNQIQWSIVEMVSRPTAVSIYFGDYEQAIFSFMGASLERLNRIAQKCEVHYFKQNFRSAPYLLDIFVRYSLMTLRSKWEFLPTPGAHLEETGKLLLEAANITSAFAQGVRLLNEPDTRNVAYLVRRNKDADEIEEIAKAYTRDTGSNLKTVKVSGVELFEQPVMRDYLALVEAIANPNSRLVWARVLHLYGGVRTRRAARAMVAVCFRKEINLPSLLAMDRHEAEALLREYHPVVVSGVPLDAVLRRLYSEFSPIWKDLVEAVGGQSSFREIFELFAKDAERNERYEIEDLIRKSEDELDDVARAELTSSEAYGMLRARAERFLAFADVNYDCRKRQSAEGEVTFAQLIKDEWPSVQRLKEADLLLGDEKIVISTIHKAKGRQFDAVVIPYCQEKVFPSAFCKTRQAIDEDARVLYVGMSRAIRHLAIFWSGDRSRFLTPVVDCFHSGYQPVFNRLESSYQMPATGGQDWLPVYSRMLECNARGECPEDIRQKLEDTNSVVRRMALKLLSYSTDRGFVRDRYHAILGSRQWAEDIRTDEIIEVVNAVERLHMDELVRDKSLRTQFMMSPSPAVQVRILECYENFLKPRALSVEDAFAAKPVDSLADKELRELLHDAIVDGVYCQDGGVRYEAARILKEIYREERWSAAIDGSVDDWARLGSIRDTEHTNYLNWILQNNAADGMYRRQLMILLEARSKLR